jgi:DNA-binding FadR family transcriptional regulator
MKAEKLRQSLKAMLDSGRFPNGSRLPPERELAVELQVSRSLLRRVLDFLEAEGRIWRHVGQGTFVGSRPANTSTDLALISSLTSPAEVMEVRLVLEPRMARLASLRANAEDIEHLRYCLERTETAPNYANYGRWDATLHRAIAAAARNVLMLALFDAVNSVRQQPGWTSLWQSALTPERQATYAKEHNDVVEAIARRDGLAAETAMRDHLNTVSHFLSLETGSLSRAS